MKDAREFQCNNCGKLISISKTTGTMHRNHCPFCLTSKHLDLKLPGDRKSKCNGIMNPIGLTFKHEGKKDKYGKEKKGELMIVHECRKCGKISINRVAGDDNPNSILNVFKKSLSLNLSKIDLLKSQKIDVLSLKNEKEIKTQIFGKTR